MSCSSSKRSITCIPYVTSSAWMRIRLGVTAWMPARMEELPERAAAPHEVLPEPALRLVDPERAGPAGRQLLEVLGLLVAVQAMPVFVHRREERLERVRVVIRGDPDSLESLFSTM